MMGLALIVLFGLWAVFGVYMKERESSDLRKQAEAQLKDLEAHQSTLNERISSLETERGQEAELRDEYHVGKAGEGVVTIVDEPATGTQQTQTTDQSWWQRIFWWW